MDEMGDIDDYDFIYDIKEVDIISKIIFMLFD